MKITVNFEEYSKPQHKKDDYQYRTVHSLETEYGEFLYETITSVSPDGTSIDTELVNQPQDVEIIDNFNFSYEEDSEE